MPLAASAVATAAPVLALLHKVAPGPPLALATPLSAPIKALAKSVDAAEALHASLVAVVSEWAAKDGARLPAAVVTAQAQVTAVVGALAASLHQCVLVEPCTPCAVWVAASLCGGLLLCVFTHPSLRRRCQGTPLVAALSPAGYDAAAPTSTVAVAARTLSRQPRCT